MTTKKKVVRMFILIVSIIALCVTAEESHHPVEEEGQKAESESRELPTLDYFKTTFFLVKEGVKLFFYNIRASRVEKAGKLAIENALADALSQGLSPKEAAKIARKEGAKAAKQTTKTAKRILGPIFSSGWDFLESIYYGSTLTASFSRGTGTMIGAYVGGYFGEQRLGKKGYLAGSHLGSWFGGRMGSMLNNMVNVADILQYIGLSEGSAFVNVMDILPYIGLREGSESEENFGESLESADESSAHKYSEAAEDSTSDETHASRTPDGSSWLW